MQETFADLIRPGDTVYDLGANVGFYISGRTTGGANGPRHRLRAVPGHGRGGALQRELNAFSHVRVVDMAVADQPGEESLMTGAGPVSFRLGDDRQQPGQLVSVTSVDAFVFTSSEPAPNFIKVDVEAAEERVLLGMKDTLRRHRSTVLCEVHYVIFDFAGFLAREVEPLGYVAKRIDGDGIPEAGARFHVVLTPMAEPPSLSPN